MKLRLRVLRAIRYKLADWIDRIEDLERRLEERMPSVSAPMATAIIREVLSEIHGQSAFLGNVNKEYPSTITFRRPVPLMPQSPVEPHKT